MRLRISGPQAIVVAIAARMASRDGRPPSVSRNLRNSDLPPRCVHGSQHRLRPRIVCLVAASRGTARGFASSTLILREIEGFVAAVLQAGMGEQVDQRAAAGERALDASWADDGGCGGHHRVGRVAGFARRLGRDQGGVADEIDFGRNRDVEHGAIVFGRRSRAPAAARSWPPAAAARGRARNGRARS